MKRVDDNSYLEQRGRVWWYNRRVGPQAIICHHRLGGFGRTVAAELMRFGDQVLSIDISESNVAREAPKLSEAIIADARSEAALREAGLKNFDVAVIAIGENLTPKEFELLSFLARHSGKVVTHKQILAAVWGPAHTEDTQYLRVYVAQLRQKIEERPDDPRIIVTEPGIGYRIADTP